MKKLMLLCFTILFSVLAILSCINYSYDGVERIEADKGRITIEKPIDVTNSEFLQNIETAFGKAYEDIMFRYVDVSGNKAHYIYFKTNNTENFLSIGGQYDNSPLSDKECLSTINPEGYSVYKLKISSMLQDVSFYNWNKAASYDLSTSTYYVSKNNVNKAMSIISELGYTVTASSEVLISGKMSIPLFTFIPIFLMIMSMAFYILSSGKKNVLRKMEGFTSCNILQDEIRSNGKSFISIFFVIELLKVCFAIITFKDASLQYILFSASYTLIGIITFILGILVMWFFACIQSGSEHIKGKAPKKGMYYITSLAKCVFLVFIMFFMSIAIRNVQIAHNTYETSGFIAEKVNGYVGIPIYTNNSSYSGLEENYLAFYNATVDKYNGILIDAGNYEMDLSTGKTLQEEFDQEEVTVNRNYLQLNPIYDKDGNAISLDKPSEGQIVVLIPDGKEDRIQKYRDFVMNAYSKEAVFIFYDGVNTDVYSYNANTGSGSYGRLDEPIIIVAEPDDLEGIVVLSYFSNGFYFIKPHTNNPYTELLPLLKKCGIDAVTPETPYVLSSFDEAVDHQMQMLQIYGTQTLTLAIGLICLIIFSAKLFCENYRKKIACCLVEGYSLLRCLRPHIFVTVATYIISLLATSMMGAVMQVSMNNAILFVALILEIISTFLISKKYTMKNLSEVMKGAE